jgi:NitT/TauT family transport system substrate-binding protein
VKAIAQSPGSAAAAAGLLDATFWRIICGPAFTEERIMSGREAMRAAFGSVAAVLLIAAAAPSAGAEDALKLAIGQRGNWNTSIVELGDRAGIFRKRGLALEMLYTAGGGETQQAVLAGAVDIGTAIGTMGALGAYAKGAPLRIIAAETTGGADYWYVAAASPIKTLKDTEGKTLAYSTAGSSTHGVVLAFMKELGLKAKPVATGGPVPTLTQVMTGQIDVGWSTPPLGLKETDEGKIRVIARAADLALVRGQTIRVLASTTDVLTKRTDAIARFMDAYRESLAYIYSDNPKAMADFADIAGVTLDIARRTRDAFAKDQLSPDEIKGLDVMMPEAIALKFLTAPLSAAQLHELIQIPRPRN